MKKYILGLIMLFGVMFANAQMATVTIPVNNTFVSVQTDYNVTNTTVAYLLVKAPQNYIATQDVMVKLDSISGNHTNVAVALWGRKFTNSAWVAIGSAVNWKGTTADTTIVISNTTANRYRDYKISYTGTGTGVTKIDYQEFKLYFE